MEAGTTISFLSTKEKLQWKQSGDDVEIVFPDYNPNKIKAPYAFAVKIDNYGRFVGKPKVNVSYNKTLQPTVSISTPTEGAAVYYTADGTMPNRQSSVYSKPFTVNAATVIKAIAIKDGLINSDVQETAVKTYTLMKPVAAGKLTAGLQYKYFEAEAMSISKTQQLQPVKSGIVNDFNTDNKNRKEKYGFVFEGFIKISKTGMYDFYTISDDGSLLYIDNQLIVNNDGNHGMEEKGDKAFLAKGMHKIKVVYYDAGGDNGLNVNYNLQGENKMKIPAGILFH